MIIENRLEASHGKIVKLINEVEKVIIGKRKVIQLTLVAMLVDGHVLFEDTPGVGKTLLIKAIAKATQHDFKRIQFTPDLLPNDITGTSIFNYQTQTFEFKKGPIFSSIILADEINRATPRTQSALLEAMSEKQVTIDGISHLLPADFFVLATQNPIDHEGTYPLPEAQLDRFLFQLHIGYPTQAEELQLLIDGDKAKSLASMQQILFPEDFHLLKDAVQEVYMSPSLQTYLLALVRETRQHSAIQLGISPRGALAFLSAVKAFALTEGRHFCTPNDIQTIMPAVFAHRLVLKNNDFQRSETVAEILETLLKKVPAPVKGFEK
ncbi:AAA family ATPase [Isobaculum melis]|uniref:MoxR-like ATPase n=1 Tax=Isobaculum melis TaxID=142588 RepID=A0A1H9QJ10_9LACT|nr:MoxR family ATPase [Isobaculum melis]SER60418.1 MoxR-like ATPase [Isobaculum melis]